MGLEAQGSDYRGKGAIITGSATESEVASKATARVIIHRLVNAA